MSEDPLDPLVAALRAHGPVSPAVQMRVLLAAGKTRGWEFDTAWRWSFERLKFPHDTAHRRGWKEILGEDPTDSRPQPAKQRQAWRRAYEDMPALRREESVRLLVAV